MGRAFVYERFGIPRRYPDMSMMKKLTAAVLVAVLSLTLVFGAFAATSPVEPQDPTNPNYDPATQTDIETISGTTVKSKIGDTVTTIIIKQDPSNPSTSTVIGKSKDEKGTEVPIDEIGNGKKGVFHTKTGQKIEQVKVKGSSNTVTINPYAFKKSKVKKLELYNKKTQIKKNAFKGTKQKKIAIYLKNAKKASDVQVTKGSFTGLDKGAKIVVSKSKMSASEFNKLVKKLKTAGFTGQIVRK